MCDCFAKNCEHSYCWNRIEIHLGSGNTKRSEVKAYCPEHIPKKRKNTSIFRCKERINDVNCRKPKYGKIFLVAIEYVTSNAQKNKKINHPNYAFTRRFD